MCGSAFTAPSARPQSLTQPLLPVPRWRGTVHRIRLIRRRSGLCVAAHAGRAVHGRVEAGRAIPDGALRPQRRLASCDERDDAAILVSLTGSPALCLIRVCIASSLQSQGALRDEGGRRARGYASPHGKNQHNLPAGCQLAASCGLLEGASHRHSHSVCACLMYFRTRHLLSRDKREDIYFSTPLIPGLRRLYG